MYTKAWLQRLFGFLLCIGLWSMAAAYLNKPFLPSPLSTLAAFHTLLSQYNIPKHIFISLYRLCVSLIISLLIAFPIGFLCGRFLRIDRILSPLISFLYPMPKIVFLPIFIVLWGLGNTSKITILTFIICFQIMVIIRDETKRIPKAWIDTIFILNQNPFFLCRHLFIPCLFPALLTSLRISLGTAIAVLFFAETFVSIDGLGFLILDTLESRNYPEMYAAILLLSLIGGILYSILYLLEKKYQWH